MKIRTKLITGFAIPLVILVIVGLMSLRNTTQLIETADWTHHTYKVIDHIEKISLATQTMESALRGYLLTGSENYLDPFHSGLKKVWEEIERAQALTEDNAEQQERLRRLKTLMENQISELQETIDLRRRVSLEAALEEFNSVRRNDLKQQAHQVVDAMEGEERRLLELRDHESQFNAEFTQRSIIIGVIVSIIVILVTGFVVIRSVTGPLWMAVSIADRIAAGERDVDIDTGVNNETGRLLTSLSQMQTSIRNSEEELRESQEKAHADLNENIKKGTVYSELIERVASGDLTQRIEVDGDDHFARLGGHLNSMTESLSGITSKVQESTGMMTSTLQELAGAFSTQSSGAGEQSAAVSEITATLDEIKATSNQTLDKATALAETTDITRKEGESGLKAVEQTVSNMQAIRDKVEAIAETILKLSDQTKQIGEITTVVSNVARQSKMLALNASIEAAKAGEAGKGFAVVAGEVRDLAEQSEASTKRVQTILEDIRHATDRAVMATEEGSKEVDQGASGVQVAGDTVRSLMGIIQETATGGQQIVAAVRQEVQGIEQVVQAMGDINEVTSQFEAATRQSQEALEDLTNASDVLTESISMYRT